VARDFLGLYSDVSAMVFGIAPPSPNPVSSRTASIPAGSLPFAVMSEQMPNAKAHPTRTVFSTEAVGKWPAD
jgi:hypothetical protein